ncbi:NTP transferase domain-containing protein [Devosia ginsengisoli]|uniref:cytidylyltransferase domain-containing protein n=1 Tax=Devosia ginsengisoli TaxID=400770 RepID=UPI0026F17143|nr:NTP transferase domain-containing protein [Devosia ginsengisoli]MCR6672062.1 NTP transferase domain-containing protein [Devosia ginsengisoli]
MTVTCTIEARLNSSRLPGKSMYALGGRPLISYAVEAARASGVVDRIILCTTDRTADEVLVRYGKAAGIDVFRGSESDVAGRVAAAVRDGSSTNIFLTGDNPFVTPDLIAEALRQFVITEADYFCTTHMKYCQWWDEPPVLPTGLSVQIAQTDFFLEAEAATDANDPIREHSTMVMYRNRFPGRKYQAFQLPADLDTQFDMDRRYTVDTPADFAAAEHLIMRLDQATLPNLLRASVE